VILDVVFNHTAEGNECGPTISMRGLDNRVYYMLAPGGCTDGALAARWGRGMGWGVGLGAWCLASGLSAAGCAQTNHQSSECCIELH